MELLNIRGLEKHYPNKYALGGVDLTIESGKIVGLLGPNSAGKTTLLKVIAGLLSPDAGEIVYPKGAPRGLEAKKTISFLPDRLKLPAWMKVSDAFGYWRSMYPDYDEEKAADMQELLELSQSAVIRKLSKGMQERVALGLTFSRDVPLYLLDEPLGGIDPVGKLKVLESILSTHTENSSIVLSTHLVKDVETIFDSIALIKEGRIVFTGDCETIRQESGRTAEQVYLEVFLNAR